MKEENERARQELNYAQTVVNDREQWWRQNIEGLEIESLVQSQLRERLVQESTEKSAKARGEINAAEVTLRRQLEAAAAQTNHFEDVMRNASDRYQITEGCLQSERQATQAASERLQQEAAANRQMQQAYAHVQAQLKETQVELLAAQATEDWRHMPELLGVDPQPSGGDRNEPYAARRTDSCELSREVT